MLYQLLLSIALSDYDYILFVVYSSLEGDKTESD